MSPATIVQIVGWGVQLIQTIGNLVTDAVKAAQGGEPPTLDELDARLMSIQAKRPEERAKEAAEAKAAADKALYDSAEAEFSAEIKKL